MDEKEAEARPLMGTIFLVETVWSLKLPGLNAYALREEQNG